MIILRGERLTYTTERIYGIDLSRHQHEQNNKYYHIYWNKLRITDLGTLSSKTINGKVDSLFHLLMSNQLKAVPYLMPIT